jgi:hypothetical protein
MVEDERLIESFLDVYCYHRNCGCLRKLLTGGDEGIGTLIATTARLVFIRAKGGKQRLLGTPAVKTLADIEPLLDQQGGFFIPLSAVNVLAVTFSGFGRYGHGKGSVSELTIASSNKIPSSGPFSAFQVQRLRDACSSLWRI